MKGTDFLILMEAERKFKRNEPLNAEDWRVVNAHGITQPKLCGCGCGQELEPRVDGERHTIKGKGEVNSDCYFDSFGKELEDFPILPPRLRRGVASATKLANQTVGDIDDYLGRLK